MTLILCDVCIISQQNNNSFAAELFSSNEIASSRLRVNKREVPNSKNSLIKEDIRPSINACHGNLLNQQENFEPLKYQADAESPNENWRMASTNETNNTKTNNSRNKSAKEDSRKIHSESNDQYTNDHYSDTAPLAEETAGSNKFKIEQVKARQNKKEQKYVNQKTGKY